MNFIKSILINDIKRSEANNEVRVRKANVAWPSESMAQLGKIAVGECKRTMFYKIMGVQPTNPSSSSLQTICDAGLMYEKYHIDKYKRDGMHVEEQVPISYTLPTTKNKIVISGKGDELISHGGKLRLVELKSVSSFKAPNIMGSSGKTTPLPAANNLMQAMLYKFYFSSIDEGKSKGVDEVYLQYVNRSDGSTFYYKVDLNPNGYAVLTAIDYTGKELYTLDLETVSSFSDIEQTGQKADSETGRLAELRICVTDVFNKFDDAYTHANAKIIPDKDYSLVYTQEELEFQYKLGRLSTMKYNKMKNGTDVLGDYKCQYCMYQKQCLTDSGSSLT